jgi:Flp pilus assembly protein TadG
MRSRDPQRGQVIRLAAIFAAVLCGFAAIAVDQGMAYTDRRSLQGAADAAATAGTRSASQGPNAVDYVVMQYLSANLGFSMPAGCTVSTSCPAGTYTVQQKGFTVDLVHSGGYLDVSVNHSRSTLLAGVIGFAANGAAASARVALSATCAICVLDPTTNNALFVENSGSLLLTSTSGEGIVVNSSDPSAVNRQSTGTISTGSPAAPLSVVGGVLGSFTTPTPVTGVAATPDPLSGLPAPSTSYGPDRGSAVDVVGTILPGVYTQIGLNTQITDMTMAPGLYIVKQSFFNNAAGTIRSLPGGVTIYLACPSWPIPCRSGGEPGAGVTIQNTGGLALTAPTTGTYQGIAMFMDRNNTSTVQLQSQGTVPITGTIYGVSGTLTYTSNGPTTAIHSGIVMGRVDVQAAQDMQIHFDPAENSPYFAWARNRDLIR